LGAINIWTHGGDTRLIGDIVFEIDFLKNNGENYRVVGFENHAGKTYLGEGVKPLGKVIKGSGNNGEDGFEGAVYKNTFCTYSHGSLLPKNPVLADHLIMLALLNKYPDFQGLSPLDDELENLAHESLIKRFIE
jgi:CobQ-like glutamine amidotransferase family enzyme